MFETKKQLKDMEDRMDAIDGRIRALGGKIGILEIALDEIQLSLTKKDAHAKKTKKK